MVNVLNTCYLNCIFLFLIIRILTSINIFSLYLRLREYKEGDFVAVYLEYNCTQRHMKYLTTI